VTELCCLTSGPLGPSRPWKASDRQQVLSSRQSQHPPPRPAPPSNPTQPPFVDAKLEADGTRLDSLIASWPCSRARAECRPQRPRQPVSQPALLPPFPSLRSLNDEWICCSRPWSLLVLSRTTASRSCRSNQETDRQTERQAERAESEARRGSAESRVREFGWVKMKRQPLEDEEMKRQRCGDEME
jgi:hypothetical protein